MTLFNFHLINEDLKRILDKSKLKRRLDYKFGIDREKHASSRCFSGLITVRPNRKPDSEKEIIRILELAQSLEKLFDLYNIPYKSQSVLETLKNTGDYCSYVIEFNEEGDY